MKNQILKHTGLTEKEFYKKYPTTDDFFNSPQGKSFKKAQGGGTYMGVGNIPKQYGTGIPTNTQIPPLLQDPYQNINVAKPKLPTDPIQDEMLSAKSLIGKPSKAEQEYTATGMNQQILGIPPNSASKPSANKFGAAEAALLMGPVAGTISSFMDERNKRKEAEMWKNVTGLQLQASKTRPEQYDKKYVRPEDQIITGEELFPVGGVGTNPIAQNGSMIGGNPTEIQNMYNPYDLYEDLGYEPLNDSTKKQYQSGGFMDFLGAASGPINSGVSTLYDNNAGYQAGNTLGQAAKFIPGIGPVASAIASPVLGFIGGQLDKTFGDAGKIAKAQKATDRNISQMQLGQQAASVQAGLASHMENGGSVQPQVLKYFGNHAVKDLFKPDPMMNTLQDGGELQTHWGGYAEPISQNPYLPDGGQTVMFRGQSHGDTDGRGNSGIGVTYGNNQVEVERGEPAMKLQDRSGDPNMVVFGNLPINKDYANLLGDPKATNKRFKNYVADLSKQEAKHTKTLDKNTVALNNLEVIDPYDKLTFASHQANMIGSNMNLKNIADKKQKAAFLQNAINETRDELSDKLGYKVSAEQLAKNGKITKDLDPVTNTAKYGSIIKAVKGEKLKAVEDQNPPPGSKGNVDPYQGYSKPGVMKGALDQNPIGPNNPNPIFQSKEAYEKYKQETNAAYDDPEIAKQLVNYFLTYEGPDQADVRAKMSNQKTYADMVSKARELATDYQPGRYHINTGQFQKPAPATPATPAATNIPLETKDARWMNLVGAALPYLRPSNAGRLDPNQLMGEMYALSNNQVEPVQAQSYQPQLDVPYDISLQDQLNQVTSQTRAAQRMAGYNPSAQAMIAGQAYAPANQILGEQFRANQAMKAGVYDRNRATMNQAQMTNLGLYDQQAQRQSQAVSNTKQIGQAALSSIADKYQKNALENKQLQTYENLYNYRYGPGMRAINMNPLYNPNIPQVYNEGQDYADVIPVKDEKGNIKEYRTKKTKEATARNGSIVKAIKRM